jgi:hypothetical protein
MRFVVGSHSALERWKSHAFGMGMGYDTRPQLGHSKTKQRGTLREH